MNILGKTVEIKWGYAPNVEMGLKWAKLYNGNYSAKDRNNDVYRTTLTVVGKIADVQELDTLLLDNKDTQIDLELEDHEKIFGVDVINSVLCYVEDKGNVGVISSVLAEMSIKLLALGEPGKIIPTVLPNDLSFINWDEKYKITNDIEIKNVQTVSRTIFNSSSDFIDRTYTVSLLLTNEEMLKLKYMQLVEVRGGTTELPNLLFKPFGASKTGPYTVRIIDVKEKGRINYMYWAVTITLALEE